MLYTLSFSVKHVLNYFTTIVEIGTFKFLYSLGMQYLS